jgi:hypothetical protein
MIDAKSILSLTIEWLNSVMPSSFAVEATETMHVRYCVGGDVVAIVDFGAMVAQDGGQVLGTMEWILSEAQDLVIEETKSIWPAFPGDAGTCPLPLVLLDSESTIRAGYAYAGRWALETTIEIKN